MEIEDINLKRLQESLFGSSSTNSRQAHQPPKYNAAKASAFPASASGGFQQPNESIHTGSSSSIPASHHKPVKGVVVQAQRVNNFEVADDEVDTLIPPIPSSFPEIDDMPLSEVKRLIDSKEVMEEFVENTSALKTLRELKQSVENSNVEAAKANLLDHEEVVKEVCTEVETLKQDLATKIEQYKKLDAERLALTHPPDTQEAIKELGMAKKEAENVSDEMGEEWVESGGENISDFVKNFMEVRILYHTRAAKTERLEMSM